ncbi:uncharacterized protein [Zea mays]|jgi:hypothetical protein|uniref:Uncharacterized protein n=1 Tax=Zea mays TaxID=4577 RepID=A0A1D6MFT9_MAIZE|nr:uncharacterized protein LOC103649565 [Zea mays]ONM28434.1 hypothetical protein ZEAMMB73_Zm00001d039351 [Zea mays]|eukprot:XP_008673523.1 uncharacterized protein LOC103649565 [Zea mays]
MGNVLPCLVQQAGTAAGALPAMNPKRRLISLKLLTKAIHKMKKRLGPGKAAKIDSKPLPSSAAVEGGEVRVEARSKATSSTNSRKGAVLRTRLHGRSSGLINKQGKKGVVRVKVVLTKEEAARLLALTVGGQRHTAAQIVAEMKKMEARRAAAGSAAWRPALASIPEESS